MTKREASNINPEAELALYSFQIDFNLAVYHQFGPDGSGRARALGGVKSVIFLYLNNYARYSEVRDI